MAITLKDKKIIFEYLKNTPSGLHFTDILEPQPEIVRRDGVTMYDSVRKVESSEDDLFGFWNELQRNGLIRPKDRLNHEHFVLTEKGKQIAETDCYDLDLLAIDIETLVTDPSLRSHVANSFKDQQFEDAVFKAFKHVEERVRKKAGLPSAIIGAQLMTDALNHQRGILKIRTCHNPAEEEGAYLMFKGAIQLLKNPSSHRTVDWKNPKQAAEAILIADFLLNLLDNAVKR